ncbi:hypothetical protein ABZ330_30130 [Streptomyces sp. NPDC006172]|uniref:hypothetical protein n=1 Tax=Streptomyces sp. NPDC006172 TaxID=3154470 RepID=UPI00340F4362
MRTSGTTIRDITAFAKWINTYCAAHTRPDAIPETDGRLPHLTLSQFRRTLAWFIARRPGGTIAGALQYRHQRIQMFEGYANPRELHQMSEKSQVACSRVEPDGLRHYYDLTS